MADLYQPEFDRQSRMMEQRLANMGLPMGSEAYTTETSRLANDQQRAYVDAARQAVLAGRAEQDRQARLAMDQYATGLAGQGQQFGQDVLGFQQALTGAQSAFGNQLSAAQHNNSAQMADYQARLAANAQRFGQADTGFRNLLAGTQAAQANQLAVGAQNYDQQLRDFQAALAGQQTQYGQDEANFQNRAAQRQQVFSNQMAANQQSFNQRLQASEQQRALAAQLLGMVPGQSTVPIDVLSPMMQNQNIQAAQYNQALANSQAAKTGMMNTLGDLGSAAIQNPAIFATIAAM